MTVSSRRWATSKHRRGAFRKALQVEERAAVAYEHDMLATSAGVCEDGAG
jgi:hypothetical protein